MIVKRLLHNPVAATAVDLSTPIPQSCGVRLPKINVPTFSGKLLHLRLFWEQFCISVHHQRDISATEKLVYSIFVSSWRMDQQRVHHRRTVQLGRPIPRCCSIVTGPLWLSAPTVSSACEKDLRASKSERGFWERTQEISRHCLTATVRTQCHGKGALWPIHNIPLIAEARPGHLVRMAEV